MNDYNEVKSYLAHFGITGQKKGLRRFQSYLVAPTSSGMVGQEVGEAAKQRGRLGKKVKKGAKEFVKRARHATNPRKTAGEVAGSVAKTIKTAHDLSPHGGQKLAKWNNKRNENAIKSAQRDIDNINAQRENLKKHFSDAEIDDMIKGLQDHKSKLESRHAKNLEFQKRQKTNTLTYKDGPAWMIQEMAKSMKKQNPTQFGSRNTMLLMNNAKTGKSLAKKGIHAIGDVTKPARTAVGKGVKKAVGVTAPVVKEAHNILRDVEKASPQNVRKGNYKYSDSFVTQAYKRSKKRRKSKS